MPSTTHQWLVLWAARKMTADGYIVSGCDGRTPQGGLWNALASPFVIAGVRPDLWAVSPTSGRIAIGEAKTPNDIVNGHTRHQLSVFARLLQTKDNSLCRVYLAVPRSAATLLNRMLRGLNMEKDEHVVCIYVPDCFVAANEQEECEIH
jgi:hypothetical protein